VSYVGHQRYFLTLCTFERRRHFTSHDVVLAVRSQFVRPDAERAFAVLAYCFMPDHLHLLVEGASPTADLVVFVSTFKQCAAYAVRDWIRGRLWQRGYFDRILRAGDDAVDVARYIVANPVRAGLVQSPADYPFLGSDILSIDQLVGTVQWKPR
jgi:putative transposase